MLRFQVPHFILLLLPAATLFDAAYAQTDPFAVIVLENYDWNNTEWSLTTPQYLPGQYQARIHLANG